MGDKNGHRVKQALTQPAGWAYPCTVVGRSPQIGWELAGPLVKRRLCVRAQLWYLWLLPFHRISFVWSPALTTPGVSAGRLLVCLPYGADVVCFTPFPFRKRGASSCP